jgi:hypothetical protein
MLKRAWHNLGPVAGLLALFIAMGGPTWAAQMINGKNIKAGTVTHPDHRGHHDHEEAVLRPVVDRRDPSLELSPALGDTRGGDDLGGDRRESAERELSPAGVDGAGELCLDVDGLDRGRRPVIRMCRDWTERRDHVAGAFGALLATHALEHGWVLRRQGSRGLTVTDLGRRAVEELARG